MLAFVQHDDEIEEEIDEDDLVLPAEGIELPEEDEEELAEDVIDGLGLDPALIDGDLVEEIVKEKPVEDIDALDEPPAAYEEDEDGDLEGDYDSFDDEDE